MSSNPSPSSSGDVAASSSAAASQPAAAAAFTFVPPPLTCQNPATPAAAKEEQTSDETKATEEAADAAAYTALVSSSSMDEKLVHGRAFLKSGATTKAVDLLARALEEFVAKYGEFSLHCAVVYRSYGAALLAHYQAHSSVLGEVLGGDESRKARVLGTGGDENAESDEDCEQDGNTNGGAIESDNEDLTLAYEVLETARVIYARHYTGAGKPEEPKADEEGAKEEEKKEEAAAAAAAASSAAASSASASGDEVPMPVRGPIDTSLPPLSQKEIGLALSYTYEILASFFMEKEDFSAAYGDYAKALQLALPHSAASSRDVAALHTDMAVCALFDSKPELALESYKAAAAVFKLLCSELAAQIASEKVNPTPLAAAAASSSAATSVPAASSTPAPDQPAPLTTLEALQRDLADCKDILDETQERIDDITAQLALPAADQALALVKAQVSTTGSGFDAPSAAPAAAANPFAMPSSSAAPVNPFAMPASTPPAAAAAAAAASTPVVTHAPQVKRKVKPTPVAQDAAANNQPDGPPTKKVRIEEPAAAK